MPNRYEREIEEILRNMERTEPKPSFRERLNMRRQARTRHPEDQRPRPARPSLNLNFSTSEWCFILGIFLGLVAGGWAFVTGANILTGFLAVLAFICLIMGIFTTWREGRRSAYSSSSWRSNEPIPIRQRSIPQPFRFIVTTWRLFLLKLRHRRYKGDY
jgi:hypothetical protein